MTLEELYYVAVVAIIGSPVAIYFQQRQTNTTARAQISQGASASPDHDAVLLTPGTHELHA